jgi:hypothetical protein
MLLERFDSEVVNLPNIADSLDESGKLGERDFSITTVPDQRCKGAVVLGARTERPRSASVGYH